jgi:hypothetical protein
MFLLGKLSMAAESVAPEYVPSLNDLNIQIGFQVSRVVNG